MKLWRPATWVGRTKLAVAVPVDGQDKLSGGGRAPGGRRRRERRGYEGRCLAAGNKQVKAGSQVCHFHLPGDGRETATQHGGPAPSCSPEPRAPSPGAKPFLCFMETTPSTVQDSEKPEQTGLFVAVWVTPLLSSL